MTFGQWDDGLWDNAQWGGNVPINVETDTFNLSLEPLATGLAIFLATDALDLDILFYDTSTIQARDFATSSIVLILELADRLDPNPPGRKFTPPTDEYVIDREGLWRYYSYHRTRVVVIDHDGDVTPYPGAVALTDPTTLWDIARDGSGENGKAVFRRRTHRGLTLSEYEALADAGYGAHLEPSPSP